MKRATYLHFPYSYRAFSTSTAANISRKVSDGFAVAMILLLMSLFPSCISKRFAETQRLNLNSLSQFSFTDCDTFFVPSFLFDGAHSAILSYSGDSNSNTVPSALSAGSTASEGSTASAGSVPIIRHRHVNSQLTNKSQSSTDNSRQTQVDFLSPSSDGHYMFFRFLIIDIVLGICLLSLFLYVARHR